jgi:hypothetical protein
MRISEILNEDNYAFNTPQALVRQVRSWYLKQPMAQKRRANELANASFKKWAIHLDRLEKGGVRLDDLRDLQEQLSNWATKFFNQQEPVSVPLDAISNANAQKSFISALVYRRLAGMPLNMNGTGHATPASTQTNPSNRTPGAAPMQTQPNNMPVSTGSAPVGASIVVNAGTYSRNATGWVNEKGVPVTKPSSIRYLENAYKQQQNKRKP